ncbi:MAG: biopolymer transport protein ExbD [Cellvibrionaceae bacterium]|jgi:biopolymer transport protein ExbD
MIGSTFLYQRKKAPFAAKLSLVSLMDIFTILVFFLLLNSGESENIENIRFVELPGSTTGTPPHKELIVSINKDEVWLEGKVVAKVAEITANPDGIIESLAQALALNTEIKGELTGFEKENGLAVTIMGDKWVPYEILKSVMATCRLNDYRNISLAVNHVVTGAGVVSSNSTAAANTNSVGG